MDQAFAPLRQVREGQGFAIVAAKIAAIVGSWWAAATRPTLIDLTPDQLRDVGYPEIPRAVLIVEARLMAELMSMR